MVFMMKMMKFRKMPLLLLLTSQNMGGIVEISQIATQIICIAVSIEGKDEISIMAKALANTLAIYLACLEIL